MPSLLDMFVCMHVKMLPGIRPRALCMPDKHLQATLPALTMYYLLSSFLEVNMHPFVRPQLIPYNILLFKGKLLEVQFALINLY